MRTTTLLAGGARGVPSYLLPSLALWAMGCILHIVVYESLEPVVACVIIFLLGASLLRLLSAGGDFDRVGFRLVFSIGWFMAGIASVYANYLNDPGQTFSDSADFFDLASGSASGSLEDFQSITEGAGAIVLWRAVYDAFAVIGFEKGRFLGVLVNVISVALSGVLAIKMARLTYGNDASRLNRLIILFSLCGLFWLFAALHLRDGVVLLAITALAYVWTRYLAKPGFQNLVFLVGSTVFAFGGFAFLRAEFVFVPMAMLLAGVAAVLIFDKSRGHRKVVIYILAFTGVAMAGVVYLTFQEELFTALISGEEGYAEGAKGEASSDSLGMAFIVSQPLPIRLILGSAYLYVFPIPFWTGFQLESAYHLFKSLNALFFYALIPLIVLSFLQIACRKSVRTPAVMFQLFLVLGFTLAIAGTSLETRHLGAFLGPVFVLALLPDLTLRKDRNAYKVFLVAFLFMMTVLHFAWLVIKLLG